MSISARVKEHYQFLINKGYEVVATFLQGSQNYNLDEYSDDYISDVDTKSIVLPHFKDIVKGSTPISTVEILDNNEHAEVKDIRIMFEMFEKMNISYIELLYSKYVYINPKYQHLVSSLLDRRAGIAAYNEVQFLKCIYGMACEKCKALCHPYPNTMEKIEKYGYDGKQLSHCARLYYFVCKYLAGLPLEDCYDATEFRAELMNYKKQLRYNGLPLNKEDAIDLCEGFRAEIRFLIEPKIAEEPVLDASIPAFLDELKCELIAMKLKGDLLNEKSSSSKTIA